MIYTQEANDILQKGFNVLTQELGERNFRLFINLINAEFDYVQWKHDYFDSLTPEQIDADMEAFFNGE